MSTNDWLAAARGTPIEEGDRIRSLLDGAVLGFVLENDPTNPLWYAAPRGRKPPFASAWAYRSDVVPDLTHPPTRAKYDRRLALALGAPEEAVNACGVSVAIYPQAGGGAVLALYVGVSVAMGRVEPDWSVRVRVGHWEPLLARALAWPADKRVTG